MAVLAVAGGFAACDKDKRPEGPPDPTDFSSGCEAVDLGITTTDGKPLKWASYNVGAQDEEGFGSYFAWGETTEKTKYDWLKEGDYKWGIYDKSAKPKFGMTKYTSDEFGSGDGLKTLQPDDDPATVNWGTKWRTPTIDEIRQLLDDTKCEWTWDATKKGFTVKGLKTGNSIFLPAAGFRARSYLHDDGEYGNCHIRRSRKKRATTSRCSFCGAEGIELAIHYQLIAIIGRTFEHIKYVREGVVEAEIISNFILSL